VNGRPTLADVRKWPATVDVESAAAALGVSRSTAYEAIRTDSFPARVVMVSRRKLVITSSLLALLGDGNATAGH
jgi:predicted DNA-binding transcriptional regulator AlpA